MKLIYHIIADGHTIQTASASTTNNKTN